jgi:hypothetical protein
VRSLGTADASNDGMAHSTRTPGTNPDELPHLRPSWTMWMWVVFGLVVIGLFIIGFWIAGTPAR